MTITFHCDEPGCTFSCTTRKYDGIRTAVVSTEMEPAPLAFYTDMATGWSVDLKPSEPSAKIYCPLHKKG